MQQRILKQNDAPFCRSACANGRVFPACAQTPGDKKDGIMSTPRELPHQTTKSKPLPGNDLRDRGGERRPQNRKNLAAPEGFVAASGPTQQTPRPTSTPLRPHTRPSHPFANFSPNPRPFFTPAPCNQRMKTTNLERVAKEGLDRPRIPRRSSWAAWPQPRARPVARVTAPGSAIPLRPSPKSRSSPLGGDAPEHAVLTWQRDPTTTMTIQWLGAGNYRDKSIHYKLAAAPRPSAANDGHQAISEHRAQGPPLRAHRPRRPAASTSFRSASTSPTYRFRTMPAKATDTIQFVSGGDSGVGEHAVATNSLAARQDPRFVLIGGDLAYDNGESPADFHRVPAELPPRRWSTPKAG